MTHAVDALVGPHDAVATEVTGGDRLSYLDDVLTQQVESAPSGTATSGLLLDAHGAPMLVTDIALLDARVVLVTPRGCQEAVDRLLAGRTFLADARFATMEGARVLRVVGPDAVALVADVLAVDLAAGRALEVDGEVVLALPDGVLVVTRDAAARREALSGAGATDADAAALDSWEVANGVPTWGQEIAAGHLPEEVGLLPTHVHLAKGCYPGQEAVARMWMLGRPRRRLAVVSPDPGVEAGWDSGGGRRGARVTRVAAGPDGPVALAFVPGDAEPGDRIETDEGVGIEVRSLVGADREVVGHDPGVTRRRDR